MHESGQCTMGRVFSVFLFSFSVVQQCQGLHLMPSVSRSIGGGDVLTSEVRAEEQK